MTKQEYTEQFQTLTDAMLALQKRRDEMKEAYLLEHVVFKPGDAVSVTYDRWGKTATEIAVVRSVTVDASGALNYTFHKMKKDGTASAHKLYVYGDVKEIKPLPIPA